MTMRKDDTGMGEDEAPDFNAADMAQAIDADEDLDENTPDAPDGWCLECGETFRLDDTGGYNPPCPCGCGACRGCHRDDDDFDDVEFFDDE